MPAKSDPRIDRGGFGGVLGTKPDSHGRGPEARRPPHFYRRRPLGKRELAPAIAVGIAAGFLAFYVAQVFLRRAPLVERASRGRSPIRTTGG